jgi:hypothetical protein
MGFLTNIFTHGTLNAGYSTFKNVLGSVYAPIRDATHKFNSIVHTADKYITMARNIPGVGEALAFVQGNPVYQSVIQLANEANSIVDVAPLIGKEIDNVIQPLVDSSDKALGTMKDASFMMNSLRSSNQRIRGGR